MPGMDVGLNSGPGVNEQRMVKCIKQGATDPDTTEKENQMNTGGHWLTFPAIPGILSASTIYLENLMKYLLLEEGAV